MAMDRLTCFGFDWLGRQFALDSTRGDRSDPEVLMFEPGTGQALEIPVPFSAFHDEELVEYVDAALASDFFAAWRSEYGQTLAHHQSAGYRVPLFLGGQDTVSNLEVTDTDVYWTVLGQLRQGARQLPSGSTLRDLTIGE